MYKAFVSGLITLSFSNLSLADTLPGSSGTMAGSGASSTVLSTSNTATISTSSDTTPLANNSNASAATTLPGSSNTVAGSGASSAILSTSNTATISTSSNTAPLANSNATAPVSLVQYCPSIDQLSKDSSALTWSAPGGWQSYQKSFAIKVNHFTGAQWSGIQVGQIICTYRSNEADTFPIQLLYNKLVFQPTGGTWGQNMGGYINCKSNDINDCPFPVKLTQKTDVMSEAAEIKPTPPVQEAF